MTSNNLNILQINTTDTVGGAANVAFKLTEHLSKNDLNIKLLVGKKVSDSNLSNPITYLPMERKLGLFCDHILGVQYLLSYPSTLLLPFYSDYKKSNIIHFHNTHGGYLNLLTPTLLASKNKKIFWTLHDTWLFSGKCAYFYDCEKWLTACHNCERFKEYPKSFYYDFSSIMHKIKKKYYSDLQVNFICPSLWIKNILEKSYMAKNIQNCYHIPTPVDIEIFKPIDKNIAREKLTLNTDKIILLVLCAKLEDERKGFKYFLNVLENMPQELSNKIKILIIGQNNENIEVKNILNKYDHCELGYIYSKEKLALAYAASDLFVFTSILDNQPCTIFESLACGTPIIGFNSGGVGEQIIDNVNGILIENKNSDKLTQELINLINSPEKIQELTENTTKNIERLSFENYAQKHIEIYTK